MSVQQVEEDLSHPRELVRPCLLLLVAESPGHGYDLMARIRQFGFDWGGPGPVYRELRVLESGGLIASSWTEGDAGPARRVYSLTPKGVDTLSRWAERLHDLRGVLDDYSSRFRSVARGEATAEAAPGVALPEKAADRAGRTPEPPDDEGPTEASAADRRRRPASRGLFRRR